MELQPTGDVSEYTATVSYEVLKEGKEGRHKVDTLVASLNAEGKSYSYKFQKSVMSD